MDTRTTIPLSDHPLTRNGDQITEAWFRFFLTLFNRTGAGEGSDLTIVKKDISDIQAAIQAEDYGAAIAAIQSALNAAPPDVVTAALIDTTAQQVSQLQAQIESMACVVQAPVESLPAEVASVVLRDDPPADVYAHGALEGGELHALATSATAGFMSSADKSKLDVYPSIVVSPVVVTADILASNTASDVSILSVSTPANSLQIGSTFESRAYFLINAAALAGSTFTVWIKLNATKVLNATFSIPAVGLSNQTVAYSMLFTVRTTGAAGTFYVSCNSHGPNTLFTSGTVINLSGGSIDTTTANTLSIGMNWSAANAGNVATAKSGILTQGK